MYITATTGQLLPRFSPGKRKGNAHFQTYKSSLRFTFNKPSLFLQCSLFSLPLLFQNNKYEIKSLNSSSRIRRIWNEDEKLIWFSKSTSVSSMKLLAFTYRCDASVITDQKQDSAVKKKKKNDFSLVCTEIFALKMLKKKCTTLNLYYKYTSIPK